MDFSDQRFNGSVLIYHLNPASVPFRRPTHYPGHEFVAVWRCVVPSREPFGKLRPFRK